MALIWKSDLNTNITVIDNQHRRLVDYINQLEEVREKGDRKAIGKVLNDLVDYTISHFAFEESLLEEAGYNFLAAHRRVHELFTRRVAEYKHRFEAGEDVGADVHQMLSSWLINHIKHDDADYVSAVRVQINDTLNEKKNTGWLKRTLGRFF
ncbi:MAG: bacteriohemerythrin [Xanthomonadaceae bacterium]|jgi:hemerythrin|nr:bacteriohemerythrin [Xanthomonadaceae bacterium]